MPIDAAYFRRAAVECLLSMQNIIAAAKRAIMIGCWLCFVVSNLMLVSEFCCREREIVARCMSADFACRMEIDEKDTTWRHVGDFSN